MNKRHSPVQNKRKNIMVEYILIHTALDIFCYSNIYR